MTNWEMSMRHEDVVRELDKPAAQELLRSAAVVRLAYTARDLSPRVVPIGFHWDGTRLVVCTQPDAPKVAALLSRPQVALAIDTETLPPRALLIRGTVDVDIVPGVPPEYLAANTKVGGPEDWASFEVQVRALYDRMAKITIEPTWAKLLDFETTIPTALAAAMRTAHSA